MLQTLDQVLVLFPLMQRLFKLVCSMGLLAGPGLMFLHRTLCWVSVGVGQGCRLRAWSASLRWHVASVASAGFTPAATEANLKCLAACIGLSVLGSSANVLI